MLRSLCAILLALMAQSTRSDCECLWQGSFDKIQATTSLVISGHVVAAKGNSIDVAVLQTLRGAHHNDPIRVWLKFADDCRPDPGLFPTGSTWVMALDRIDDEVPGGFNPGTPNLSYGRIGDYSLSSCGGYWLRQRGDTVTGPLVDSPRWDRQPPMTPVLLDLVAEFVAGNVGSDALLAASRQDPATRQLILDTRAFLRGESE